MLYADQVLMAWKVLSGVITNIPQLILRLVLARSFCRSYHGQLW
jgi:hypothetical protein